MRTRTVAALLTVLTLAAPAGAADFAVNGKITHLTPGVAPTDAATVSQATGGGLSAPVADTSLATMPGLSVKGRSANTTGTPVSLVAATDGHVLRLSGTALGFGQLALGAFADGVLTPAKLVTSSATGTFGSASAVMVCTLTNGVATSCSSTTISVPSAAISDSTSAGRALLTAASAAAQKSALAIAFSDVSGTVALNQLATGVAGRVLAYDASGNPTSVGPGTTGQALLSNGAGAAPTFQTLAGGGNALTTNPLSQFAATTSSQFFGVISDETGSGLVLGATNPTFGGFNLHTEIAAPSSPSAGFGSCYVDSTSHNWACKRSTGVVNHGVQTSAAVSHQFLTGTADDGTVTRAQPDAADLTGFAAVATSGSASDLGTGTLPAGRIGANSVAISKLATGTAGNLITYDASGQPAAVATGTTGQALLSNGAGAAPTFQTLPGGGDALTTNPLSQFAATTSAQLFGVLTNETGSGLVVGGTNPTFASYDIFTAIAAPGTPSAGLARCYIDSTSLNWACKNASAVINHGVQTLASSTSQYVISIDDDGTVHTGGVNFTDLAGTITGTQIPSTTVTNAKLANMANGTTKCRTTAGTGVPEDCTASQEKTLLGLAAVASSGAASDVSGLATVATSGSASDITTGTLPIGQVSTATNAQTIAGSSTSVVTTPANVAALFSNGTDNSGGATITMGDGRSFNLITSTTAITAFAFTNDATGRQATIRFNTVRTLTQNSTSLILPTGANITTAVGDICQIESRGSGNFRVNWYTRADGTPLAVPSTVLLAANNLSDVASASTSRTNLGISTIGNTGAIADSTGTLAVARGGTGTTTSTGTTNVVLSNSPTLVTPTLGAATATSVNRLTLTAPTTSATLTIDDGFTLHASANATVSGTNTGDQTVSTMGASGALTDGTGTLLLTHGGTGQTTAAAAFDALTVKGADIASASTTNLATATGHFVHVTGTTTITAFGTAAAGVWRVVEYTGALTVTHNSTSLILLTAANRTTAAGDMQMLVSEGSGNWREAAYFPQGAGFLLASNNLSDLASASTARTNLGISTIGNTGAISDSTGTLAIARGGTGQTTAAAALTGLMTKSSDVASASTTSLVGGDFIHVTGTTTITAFSTETAGVVHIIEYTGALTLTHNSTSLILLTAANRTTATGDMEIVVSEGSGNWREVGYFYAMPDPIGEFDAGNSGATPTIDFSTHRLNKSTLTANATYTFTAPSRSNNVVLRLVEDGTGGRTITLPSSVKWTGGTTPTFTTTANAVNVIACYEADSTHYYCSAFTQ